MKIPFGDTTSEFAMVSYLAEVLYKQLCGYGPDCCGAFHTGLQRDQPPSSVAPPDEENRESKC